MHESRSAHSALPRTTGSPCSSTTRTPDGRCSITGGYVYRGTQGTLPNGTYVYGDYCSGEVFSWNGSAQTPLLDTTINISSFGEDEAGELYVVGLGGNGSPDCCGTGRGADDHHARHRAACYRVRAQRSLGRQTARRSASGGSTSAPTVGCEGLLTTAARWAAAVSTTVTGLPSNRTAVFVRLWFRINGAWQSTDFQYTAAGGTPTLITSRAGQRVAGFERNVQLDGERSGSHRMVAVRRIHARCEELTTTAARWARSRTATVTGLPRNGSPVFVRLWFKDQRRVADRRISSTPLQRARIRRSPIPRRAACCLGPVQPSTGQPNGAAVTEWWLYAGSSRAARRTTTAAARSEPAVRLR